MALELSGGELSVAASGSLPMPIMSLRIFNVNGRIKVDDLNVDYGI